MKLTSEQAEIALGVLRAARFVTNQIKTADLDELSPVMRANLEAERDALNKEWGALAPTD